MHGLKSAIDRGADAWARSLPGRVLDRYVSRSGPLLANGLAYGLLFAFFAGVWIAVSVFGLIMVGNIDWQQMLIDAVREVIPGVADSFLTSSALGAMSSALTWTGLATLAIFWWTVTGWMNSLRHAVRAMFDDCGDELNIVVARLRDTLAAIAIAILFILSTAAGTVSGGIVRRLLQWGGILESTGFATGVLLNFALFMLLLRVVSHIKAGRFTILGALLGSLTVSAMQLLGARLLAGASRNPMLAPFAALIGVLIWFNLVAQVILLCAALIAECRQKS